MGYEYIKRPLLVANSTSSLSGVTIGGTADTVGFYGVAGSTRQAAIAAANTTSTGLNDTINSIIAVLENLGLVSTA